MFDRDGVLTKLIEHDNDKTAPWSINELEFTDTAKKAVDLAKQLGYNTFILSNQPDVKDGKISNNEFWKMHEKVQEEFQVTKTYYALDRNTIYYKPNNGALEKFIEEYNIDREKSYFIGDSWKDISCGKSSNLKTIYIRDKIDNKITPDYYAANALAAVKMIERIDNMEKNVEYN